LAGEDEIAHGEGRLVTRAGAALHAPSRQPTLGRPGAQHPGGAALSSGCRTMPLSTLLLRPGSPRIRPVVVPPLGVVCVAWVDLNQPVSPALLARLRTWLIPEEQERADRFRFEADRN